MSLPSSWKLNTFRYPSSWNVVPDVKVTVAKLETTMSSAVNEVLGNPLPAGFQVNVDSADALLKATARTDATTKALTGFMKTSVKKRVTICHT